MTCSIEGCDRRFYARTWCSMHYQRWFKYGDPNIVRTPSDCRVYTSRPDSERFWAMVDKSGDCWLWTGFRDKGYGRFQPYHGATTGAHRWAYEDAVGPIPAGLYIDHLCRTPACVNPSHLEPVTQTENTLRGTGFAAQYARQTHCKRDHEFTEANTYVTRKGQRKCRTCHREREAARKARLRAEVAA